MFEKLRSIFKSPLPVQPPEPPELVKAEAMGREYASNFGNLVAAYIDGRANTIQPAFLDLLQACLDKARSQEDHSPLLVARAEYGSFVESLDSAGNRLIAETKEDHSSWNETHQALGVEVDMDRLIEHFVETKMTELKLVGLNVLIDNADILKRADDSWRVRFPALAALEPAPQ